MNNVAVLLYKDTDNPLAIPGDWPAQTERWNNQPAPWIEMTQQELNDWKATYRDDYNTWKQSQDYDESWQEDRYANYPSTDAHLDAIVQMAEALYPVQGTMPPLMQQIVDERNTVDQKYPPPA